MLRIRWPRIHFKAHLLTQNQLTVLLSYLSLQYFSCRTNITLYVHLKSKCYFTIFCTQFCANKILKFYILSFFYVKSNLQRCHFPVLWTPPSWTIYLNSSGGVILLHKKCILLLCTCVFIFISMFSFIEINVMYFISGC